MPTEEPAGTIAEEEGGDRGREAEKIIIIMEGSQLPVWSSEMPLFSFC